MTTEQFARVRNKCKNVRNDGVTNVWVKASPLQNELVMLLLLPLMLMLMVMTPS